MERPAAAAWMANSARLVVAAPDGLTAYTMRPTNKNRLEAPEILKTRVLRTVVGGRTVYQAK